MIHTYDELDIGVTEIDGFTVRIGQDDGPESPRDWDNIGTMVCWHRRYNLGDEQPSANPDDYMIGMLGDAMEYEHDPVERERLQDTIEALEEGEAGEDVLHEWLNKYYTILPLYLYDHSGITMSTSAFSCPWDSGQVGFIYARNDKQSELGPDYTLEQALRQEVETYDQYLRGDVYYYVVEDEDGEFLDSCSGFFGFDYVREQATEALNACIDERRNAHFNAVKVWIKNGVPLATRQRLVELGEDRR